MCIPLLHKWEGIVIKTRDYGESNKIVTLMTREAGKVAVMARGAKKARSRLGSVTQPFTVGSYMVMHTTGMGTLRQGEHLESLRHIREDIYATAYASFIVELVDKVIEEGQSQPYAYEVLHQALRAIDEEYDPEAISLFVEWKLLPFIGVQPILHHCAGCSATDGEFAYSFGQGGFLCHRCFELDRYIIRLTPTQLKLIRMFYQLPIEQVGTLALKKETKYFIRKIVSTMYEEQGGLRLKTRSFIEQLERTPELNIPKRKQHNEGND